MPLKFSKIVKKYFLYCTLVKYLELYLWMFQMELRFIKDDFICFGIEGSGVHYAYVFLNQTIQSYVACDAYTSLIGLYQNLIF